MDELFLYDRDQGLFKEILKKSAVMGGRYHVSPNSTQDLNTDNLASFINDPKTGLSDPSQKYPICVCVTPRSRYTRINGQRWEEFWFSLFFLTPSYKTGNNQIKTLDPDTNTSAHHIWYDWQDMKNCADEFLEVLKMQLKRAVVLDGKLTPLMALINFDSSSAVFSRLSKFNNDELSGVNVLFTVFMYTGECGVSDYPEDIATSVTMPPLIIHPLHLQ
jgi:hypothetical protein